MNCYTCLRSLLFRFNPETAHEWMLKTLAAWPTLAPQISGGTPVTVMGLSFRNRLGLAAGMDKNAVALAAFARMGFACIEVGTVTPKSQPGNPKPRLFRVPRENALINRMGFNNDGVASVSARVAKAKQTVDAIIGVNLGRSKQTNNEDALCDYLYGMEAAYPVADYMTINISSPNTPGLRNLQHGKALRDLLEGLKRKQNQLLLEHGRILPLVVKIAPDNSDAELDAMLAIIDAAGIDGIIATNTTSDKTAVTYYPNGTQKGGLSGAPLMEKSTRTLRRIRKALPDIALIASGGVMSSDDYRDKRDAGADLVQIYSGLVYHGPALIRDCLEESET